MSLQLAAQHLASKGRGPDTTLVHMAPGEVAGLQALAKAHGGSLTVNPDTGLPEAGFLSSILPTIAGIGLSVMSGGTLSPLMAGMLTGGVTGLATGNLRKGLMAGLGAFGGAGLAGGVAGAGAAQGLGAAAAEAGAAGSAEAAAQLANAEQVARMQAAGFTNAEIAQSAAEYGSNMAGLPGGTAFTQTTQAAMANPFKAGLQGLMTSSGRDAFMSQIGGTSGLIKYGVAGAAPMLLGGEQKGDGYTPGKPNYEYTYDAKTGTYTRVPVGTRDNQPSTPPMFPGLGTLTSMPILRAEGGPVQAMSERNQAEMFVANGGQMFAEGGEVPFDPEYAPKYVYDPITKKYEDITKVRPVTPITSLPNDMGASVPNVPGNPAATPVNNAYGSFMQNVSNLAQDMGFVNPSAVPGALGIGALVPGAMTVGSVLASIANNDVTNPHGLMAQNGLDVGFHPGGMGVGSVTGETPGESDAAAMSAAAAAMGNDSAPSDGGGAPPGDGAGPSDSSGYARGGVSALVPGYAQGGYNLGDYSDGGRLLKGPGDGVSDSIPATIADKRPARLADGEFVVPARIVSELGNGSTEAGARKLYAMMDRIQKARSKTVGKDKVAVNSRAEKLLPA